MKPLPQSFYASTDVVSIAKQLLGKGLFTNFGELTGGVIIETEAYAGPTDRASHAYNNRRTKRNEVMYGPPGHAYVYLCYGLHYLLNAVTGPVDTPHAVLIRAIEPTHGIDTMMKRRKKSKLDDTLCGGPGALSAALGIDRFQNGQALDSSDLMICDLTLSTSPIIAGPRVGVDYAGPDALLPYRYRINYGLGLLEKD